MEHPGSSRRSQPGSHGYYTVPFPWERNDLVQLHKQMGGTFPIATAPRRTDASHLRQQVVQEDSSVTGPTHCFFTPAQVAYSWNSLRTWVEQGQAPDNEDITGK
ncbi:hypothetical protein [Deinococcus hopiensis]|uniref:hypothetical protein n=1 Tax=Deinococcus hopiensis TaxID=309885 RepID=UPI00111C727F|nr:hypothetical protein [Deinococcus hopiensis]